tara:strand:+ start:140 stop:646 length:507 start_codon:yes stop_codon:yes gene_type:complete
MHIEIKNIKHAASLSEETYAYTATVYVDGVAMFDVKNDGRGGCDSQYPRKGFGHDDLKRVEAWITENIPSEMVDFGDHELFESKPDLERICQDAVITKLIAGDMKRALRSKVLFTEKADGPLFEIRFKGVRKIEDKHIGAVKKKKPAAIILNRLAATDALEIYKKACK